MVVKEQRVYGNWSIKRDLMDLRCTLQGFERNRNTIFSFNDTEKNLLLFHNLINWNSYVKIHLNNSV